MPKKRRSGLAITGKLIGLVRPMLPVMVAAITMGVLGFLCAIFITVFGGYALLHVLGVQAPFSLRFIFIAVLVFAFMRGVLRYAEQASNHYIAFKLLAIIRDKVFKALRILAPAKLEGKDRGNLVTLITTDIELIEVFYAHTISPVAIAVVVSAFMGVFLATYHVALGVIAVIGYITVGVLVPLYISKVGQTAGAEYRKRNGALSSTVLDSLRGLREILQFRQGEEKLHEIETQTHHLAEKQEEMKKYEGLTAGLTNTVIMATAMAVLFCAILLHINGQIGFEAVLIPFIATIGSFGPVVALANLSNNLLQTFAAADRVLDILEEEPVTQDITNGEDVNFNGVVCEHVSFAYEDEQVLEDFSMRVKKGRVVGIQGKSGSGKSTLLRLMMRFWDVDKGSISMSGKELHQINTASLRENQSFVTQETVIFHDTIENNVKIAKLSATREEVEEACKKASIHQFILQLPNGYETNVGELGDNLSGGERQRIGLARAFLHDAPMILLDEPTSNLDSLNEGVILHSLKEESNGKTIVMVSHRASSLGIADEVIAMENRRVS